MQSITAPPRDSLTAAQVSALITGSGVRVSAGTELLASDLTVTEDISDDVAGGSVSRACLATIHGTCRLSLSRELDWDTALVRPFMILSDGATSARFNLGVYSLATPEYRYAESPVTYDAQGYDRLYLLNREVGDSYSVAAGTDVLTAIRQVFADAGLSGVLLDGSAAGKTLPRDKVWPLIPTEGQPETWLRIVNDLLAMVSYRGVWADQDGLYRSEPYVYPGTRGIEWTLDEGAYTTIQGEDRTLVRDGWGRPNKWIFVQSNRASGAAAPTEGDGIYTVDEHASDPRGLTYPVQVSLDVADQASLVALGDQRVASDKRRVSTWRLSTAPLPLAGHFDVMTLVVNGIARRVQATDWEINLDGADMSWTAQEVTA